jgi:hypothetical protein
MKISAREQQGRSTSSQLLTRFYVKNLKIMNMHVRFFESAPKRYFGLKLHIFVNNNGTIAFSTFQQL